jgi:hypothetical protein
MIEEVDAANGRASSQPTNTDLLTGGCEFRQRHYTVEELAKVWELSVDSVRRLFANEPGVVVFRRGRSKRRVYRTIRIPESVAARVHQRMTRVC